MAMASGMQKDKYPLRAIYGTDKIQNALHGSECEYCATREYDILFPQRPQMQRVLAIIKPDAIKHGYIDSISAIFEVG